MRRHLLPVLLLPLLVAAAPSAAAAGSPPRPARVAAAPPWEPDVAAARAYARSRPGTASFLVREGSRTWSWRPRRTVSSLSLVKTVFLVAYLRDGRVRDRALRLDERRFLSPMIRASDNAAATRVRDRLGTERIRRAARAAGMDDFRPRPIWGASRTSARDQARLFARVRELLPPRHRAYGMGLLRTIVARQRWGVAEAAPAGWSIHFKGGWGSGVGAGDHQAALLERDGRKVVVAITTTDNPSHAAGRVTLRGIASRLLRGLPED